MSQWDRQNGRRTTKVLNEKYTGEIEDRSDRPLVKLIHIVSDLNSRGSWQRVKK